MAQDTRRAESNASRDSVEYFSTVNPVVAITKSQTDTEITINISVTATLFDIMHCDFNGLFLINNDPVRQKLNWGKAILYNYVGVKVEMAAEEGKYNSESTSLISWMDVTNNFIEHMTVSVEPNPNIGIVCDQFLSIVARHNSMSVQNYLRDGRDIPEQYNYQYALNFNRYMDAQTDQFNANDKIQGLRNNDAALKEALSVYTDFNSQIRTVTFNLTATFQHQLSSGVKTFRARVQNPSTILSPTVNYIYHEGNDEYYTYVNGSVVPVSGSDPVVNYGVADIDTNKVKINIVTDGVFKKKTARLRFKMKRNTVNNASRV